MTSLKFYHLHFQIPIPGLFFLGLFLATFYHFYVNDREGPVGTALRGAIGPLVEPLGLDDDTFATAFVSLFMQVMGILQLPEFLGPSFTPFGSAILNPFMDASTWSVGLTETEYAKHAASKKKKRKKKPATAKEKEL